MEQNNTTHVAEEYQETKFCKECGQKIAKKAVICTHCGCQVETFSNESATATPQIVINNSNQNQNQNSNTNVGSPIIVTGRPKNKWVALFLCFFLGVFGAHKFYEGKIIRGIIYLFTCGLFGIGCIVDFIALLFKRNPYYV